MSIDNEKIRLAMELQRIEELRIARNLSDEEAHEYRMAAVLGFYSVNEEGYRMPDFLRLREAWLAGEIPNELFNIKWGEDGNNGKICECEACKERRGW